ncbi:MAG: DUF4252 domain-containing protein [Bacteroidetes bacterium]|jgi:hypothetical protein|nr:DUF4252 domain-containing protein [Bacteroidota bacterium]
MKNFLLAILILTIPITTFSQTKSINKFYRQYKKGKEVRNFKVPGFLMNLGGKIGSKHVDGEMEKMALQLVKYIKGTKIMVSEEGGNIPSRAVGKLAKDVKTQGFDDWIQVRAEDTRVSIMAREKKGTIKNMMILVNSEDSFVMMSMKMKLKPEHLANFLQEVIRQELKYEVTPKPKKKKAPTKKKKSKVPMV